MLFMVKHMPIASWFCAVHYITITTFATHSSNHLYTTFQGRFLEAALKVLNLGKKVNLTNVGDLRQRTHTCAYWQTTDVVISYN